MRRVTKYQPLLLAAGALLLLAPAAAETLLQPLSLEQMVERSGHIFRGRLVDLGETTVNAGGGELPVTVYRFAVEDAIKGTFDTKDGAAYAEVRMVGSVKETTAPRSGDLRLISQLPAPPTLELNHSYLLLTTPESAVGLSTTVGLGQGRFHIGGDKRELTANEYQNAGLFDGPVPYQSLADQLRQLAE